MVRIDQRREIYSKRESEMTQSVMSIQETPQKEGGEMEFEGQNPSVIRGD